MNFIWLYMVIFCLLSASSHAFPLFGNSAPSEEVLAPADPTVTIHHRHKKHHIRHKHSRRSLSSKEDAKARRNKQVMLTKPYWPWP